MCTLSTSTIHVSPMTSALHVVDGILDFLFLHCGYLGALVYDFISSKTWYLQNLSYSKKQREQAEAQTKQYHQSNNSGSLTFCYSCLLPLQEESRLA